MGEAGERDQDAEAALRPVRPDDLALLERLRGPEASAPYNWFGYQDAGELRRRFEQDGLLGPDAGFLVIVLADGTPVGDIGWSAVNHGRPPTSRCWNMGITLLPEYRGRGIGTAAQVLFARYLLATTTVNRIEASTDVTNLAEQRSLEKAGFTREGIMRGCQFRAGAWHDMVLYSFLRSDLPPSEPASGAPADSA